MTGAQCSQCNALITPEDATYDDHTSQYYCDLTCFYDWTDVHTEVVVEYYVKLNISE